MAKTEMTAREMRSEVMRTIAKERWANATDEERKSHGKRMRRAKARKRAVDSAKKR